MKKSFSSGFFTRRKNSALYNYFCLQDQYNKTNDQLIKFIKSKERTIAISKKKSNLNIKLYNNSIINIFKKINDKSFYIQDFVKLITISEKRDTVSIESREYFDKYINLLNNRNYFFIYIKRCKDKFDEKNKIKISKKSLKLIFKYLGVIFGEEIFNFLEIMIYEEITAYHFDEYKNLGELIYSIYNNTFGKNNFYIFNNKNFILCPITNYSIKTITSMLDINENNINNNKYFKFKIKDINVLFYGEKNKDLLRKLLMKNDYKFIYKKYHSNGGIIKKWKKIEKENNLPKIKKPNIIEFNDFLFSAEQLLNKTLSKIEKNKRNLNIKISNDNNYFIPIKDVNNKIKYINLQYIKLINKKLLLYNQKDNYNKFNCFIPDYTGKITSISVDNEEINNNYLNSSCDKYIGILNKNKKYLVKVNNLKNLLKNYKILNQKYCFNIELPSKEEKKFSFSEIDINEQVKIRNVEGKIIKAYKKNIINNNEKNNNINESINNKDDNMKEMNALFLRMSAGQEDVAKPRNNKKILLNLKFGNNKNNICERRYSEYINSDTNESTDSGNQMNKSMMLTNSYNILPEKEYYYINKVIKIIKKDRKNKDKKDKKK